MADDALHRRLIHTWARDAATFAHVLAEQDPAWRSEAVELAGGWLVLSGAGLYVNTAIGVGIDEPLTDDDIDVIVDHSAALGVTPSVEITPCTRPDVLAQLSARGFAPTDTTRLALTRATSGPVQHPDDVVVHPVRSPDDLADWQAVSAAGWGHVTAEARRAADAFARAAHAVDGEGMVIAFDAGDGRPLGCASETIREGLATLGGMSTIPAERGRGVQAALIHHRLARGVDHGCALAASTAVTDGASQRNLVRHGFVPQFTITLWQLAI